MTAVARLTSPNPGTMLFKEVEAPAASSADTRGDDTMSSLRSPVHAMHDGIPQDVTQDDDLPEPICGGCKKLIDEESADAGVIHFATQLWHVDCFRCAKCQNPVTTDRDDILLLSDGHPICGQCNYSCQICNMPIMEEAIMTGDESYHASCFVCRSCQTPIAELVFAKTSQGIYCMKCHNQRVARSRRHAEKKRMAAAAAAAAAGGASVNTSTTLDGVRNGKRSPSTPTFAHHENHSPAPGSPLPSSPLRREATGEGLTSDRHTRTDVSNSTNSVASLSPFLNSNSSSSFTRPSSAGHGSKRPVNAPAPVGLRSNKKEAVSRPSTAETFGESATPNNKLSGLQAEARSDKDMRSPLLAGVMEHEAAREKSRQQAERDKSESQLIKKAENTRLSIDHSDVQAKQAENAGLGIGVRQNSSSRTSDRLTDEGRLLTTTDGLKNSKNSASDTNRLSKAFSFYDADFANLMDSFGRFDSSDEFSLDSTVHRSGFMERGSSADKAGESKDATKSIDAIEVVRDAESIDANVQKRGSEASLSKMSDAMRLSIQRARDGHVNMNTVILEGMLDELDATRERMKTLQRKYEKIRRASQQAAQGFSSAREEYEQEVQARYDAEAEMLNLKRQLHLQASTLAELANEKRQQESLNRRKDEARTSVQQLERELTKLRIERDVTVAEVAELLAMQDGRSKDSNSEEHIKRSLVSRLESVKDKYRNELDVLASERERLAVEIEELRQSREVFTEETKALNQRNEELSGALTMLQRRVEHAQAAENLASQRPSAQSTIGRSTAGTFGFGFGNGKGQVRTPTSATTGDSMQGHNSHVAEWHDQLAVATPVPVTKIEAPPKKFKWMKAPKLTAESARHAGHTLAAALPGVTPAVPSKAGMEHQPLSPTSAHHNSQPSSSAVQAKHGHDQSISSNGASTGDIVVKEHLFQPFNVLRPVRCFACQKNMWGQSELKCSFCLNACHVRCLHNLPVSCTQPYTGTDSAPLEGPSMFGRNLNDQLQAEGRPVPLVVTKCVEVVELQGMDYEGIYRKSGGTSQLKVITQLFEKGQPFNLDDRDRFNDISAITSVLKNYFRELPDPLLTFELHERFVECAEAKGMDASVRQKTMQELVHQLPEHHFNTLRFLVEHLHRVQARANENRMSSRNLGVVFGPTLMRSADASQEFAHMGGKAMTVEFMIDHPSIFH